MRGYQIIIENYSNGLQHTSAGDIIYINEKTAKERYAVVVDSIMNDPHTWVKNCADNHPNHLVTKKETNGVTFIDTMSDSRLNIYINEVAIIYL